MVDLLDAITSMPLNVEGLRPLENPRQQFRFDPRTDIPKSALDYISGKTVGTDLPDQDASDRFNPVLNQTDAIIFGVLCDLDLDVPYLKSIDKRKVLDQIYDILYEDDDPKIDVENTVIKNPPDIEYLLLLASISRGNALLPKNLELFDNSARKVLNVRESHLYLRAYAKVLSPDVYETIIHNNLGNIFTPDARSYFDARILLGVMAMYRILDPDGFKNLSITEAEWEKMLGVLDRYGPTANSDHNFWIDVKNLSIISAPNIIFRDRTVSPDFSAIPGEISVATDQPLPERKKY